MAIVLNKVQYSKRILPSASQPQPPHSSLPSYSPHHKYQKGGILLRNYHIYHRRRKLQLGRVYETFNF